MVAAARLAPTKHRGKVVKACSFAFQSQISRFQVIMAGRLLNTPRCGRNLVCPQRELKTQGYSRNWKLAITHFGVSTLTIKMLALGKILTWLTPRLLHTLR